MFLFVLFATILAIAGSAGFFSIYGLAEIFSGAFVPVIIMASSLEVGKLVAASFTYRYWNILSKPLKAYLLVAIVVLMLITSIGIFGFLSSAYQKDISSLKLKEQQISLIEEQKQELISLKREAMQRKKQIDSDIASLPNNFVTGRQRLMKSYGAELETLKKSISSYTEEIRAKTLEIAELKRQIAEQQVHIGPIIYIAKVFNQDVDDATKWLIIFIIFAFDPLAVALTLGFNIALSSQISTKSNRPTSNHPTKTDTTKKRTVTRKFRPRRDPIT